ncbi:hypothetical protein ACFWXO_42425 [Kitasatospora sp. NPDC059088]|uniref:hypothetical protein n=1 Tax=Kitasatospora sp. NPDC059088 TaxID=3346722 RepID=UPI0036C2CEFD
MSEGGSVRTLVGVVRRQKKLLLLSGVTVAVTVGAAALLVWAEVLLGGSVVVGAAGLVVLLFLVTFGNAAMLIAVDDALRGRAVGVWSSCARAAGRLPVIAGWAVGGALTILVGAVLLVGASWVMVGYLVLPAMVLDGVGIREALRRSREVHRREGWTSVRGSSWVALPVVLTLLPSLVALVLGFTVKDRVLGVLSVAGAAVCLGGGLAVTASLSGVFRVRYYREAMGGPVEAVPVQPVQPVLHVSPVE